MAKLSVVLRNQKRIKMAAHFEPIRAELRKKAINQNISEEEREAARKKLQSLPRNGSKTRIRNRCMATGRARGVYKKFML
ncbi:MAG: 30S ribosomal protein S14, partial [SAR324 cluster bacterium]|nr:30S ribosomal protein S14 [SAR324 cluster bacterium]